MNDLTNKAATTSTEFWRSSVKELILMNINSGLALPQLLEILNCGATHSEAMTVCDNLILSGRMAKLGPSPLFKFPSTDGDKCKVLTYRLNKSQAIALSCILSLEFLTYFVEECFNISKEDPLFESIRRNITNPIPGKP